jgi:membrane-associated protein
MHLLQFLDPKFLIASFGLAGVIAIIFMETGCFFGFFFPGDSLLFTAGLLASQGLLGGGPTVGLACLFFGSFAAAVLGDSVGYSFGRRVGPAIFSKEDSFFFKKAHIAKAQHFYEEHGRKTIILARFIPVIRTFAPIVAGIGNMRYRDFIVFNAIGGFFWTALLVGIGFGFGRIIPNPDHYLLPAVVIIIVISILPALRQLFKRP